MRGPLPSENRRRRNAPTIPTTNLPASGRQDPAPRVPRPTRLGKAGRAWWRWAWATPQAAAWDDGAIGTVARRASLEDDLEALDLVDGLDLAALLELDEASEAVRVVEATLRALHRLAGGRLSVLREMRELDVALGLTPKAMAQLRWKVVDDSGAEATAGDDEDGDETPEVDPRFLRVVSGG